MPNVVVSLAHYRVLQRIRSVMIDPDIAAIGATPLEGSGLEVDVAASEIEELPFDPNWPPPSRPRLRLVSPEQQPR